MSTSTLSPGAIDRVAVRHQIASETFARLAAMDAREMSGAQFDLLADAQDEMQMRRQQLADAGRLHLIEVAR
ncbi:hypothetical protein [Streptomyces sp. NPDC048252]|uniref:hypothetical protein n=1 Tax=Streptomyces sp. NPDC048252 TaxID=3154612 RepID=UPI003434AE71